MQERKITPKDLALCALFIALIVIGTFLKIPVPVVPFTLQFLFTMMAGLLLGGRLGAFSVFGYIVLGLIGMPVFTEGGGIWYIFKPSFGYIIGFCIAAYVTGMVANKVMNPSMKRILSANFIGLGIVYACGLSYCYVISNFVIHSPIGLSKLFLYCFWLVIPGDIFLCILSALLAYKLIPLLNKMKHNERYQSFI
ncbi:biotin transporter BioY [Anaerosacchariphilus polymeriproducens]|uniref:Biotin transporter n=1 Tax=Anaerosacchariphilus polymeriproducens TaxID=1812858 RepID=A0A371AUW0_9FIRM|nr:biotin transporter BioY [Anaerosacchariphilus polymeriproducens]RDU23364.1 biotin transporter BioY [Anaerosacchariphilus polymeriproducens]